MSKRYYEHYDYYYTPSKPVEARGGIKAQSKQGSFGKNWWAKRWIEVLESFNIGSRLTRGRSYARKGQVLSIEIKEGIVKAKVQGSRPTPYNIAIKINTLSQVEWQEVITEISSQAIFTAKLLASEMPQDIEEIFEKVGLSLFPKKSMDLETNCSCPDWSNPCKHIAAVYYLLGEEFDRDPFLIFKLRGMEKEIFIEHLGQNVTVKDEAEIVSESETNSTGAYSGEPLAIDPSLFWNGEELTDNYSSEVRIPPLTAVLPKQLGNFPFWQGEEKFMEVIEDIYSQASREGLNLFLGEMKWEKRHRGTEAQRSKEK